MTDEKKDTWTIESYVAHNEALRIADEKFQTERDRRYTEVGIEKEKALKIKEIADLSALELARESQMYKDERNDQMRESSLKNNGIYATRDELADIFSKSEKSLSNFIEEMKSSLKPIFAHIAEDKGAAISQSKLYGGITILVTLLLAAFTVLNYLLK